MILVNWHPSYPSAGNLTSALSTDTRGNPVEPFEMKLVEAPFVALVPPFLEQRFFAAPLE